MSSRLPFLTSLSSLFQTSGVLLQPSCTTQPYVYILLFKSTYIRFFNCCCPSVAQMCPTLRDPTGCSRSSFPGLGLDRRQSAAKVIVKLHMRVGPVGLEEVGTTFTDTGCAVQLPSGQQWAGAFYAKIVRAPKCRLAKVTSCSCYCTRRCLFSHGPLC